MSDKDFWDSIEKRLDIIKERMKEHDKKLAQIKTLDEELEESMINLEKIRASVLNGDKRSVQ